MSTEKRASENQPFSMPRFWRFGWMVLLQPAPLDALYRRWGFEGSVSLRAVVQRARAGHAAARALLRYSALWSLALVPLAAALAGWIRTGSLGTIRWQGMLGGLASALTAWFLVSWFDIRPATRGAVLLGIPSAAVFNAASLEGAAGDTLQMTVVYLFVLFVIVLLQLYSHAKQEEREDEGFGARLLVACQGALLIEVCLLLACLPLCVGVLVAGGIPEAASMMLLVGVAFCVALEVPLGIGWMAILPPLFSVSCVGYESAALMALLAALLTVMLLRIAPRLQSFLRRVAATDEKLGAALLHETSASSIKQVSESGKRVWAELQGNALEEVANARAFDRVVDFDLPFFPDFRLLPDDSPLRAFRAVARDLTMHGQTQRRKRDALAHAAQVMKAQQVNLSKRASGDPAAGPFGSAAKLWLEVIEHEQEELEKVAAAHPEVPAVFVAGPPLTPDEEELRPLFKGRRDLVQSIEQDLLPGKRGLMVLYGQRRMGKTSLRKYLPRLLGSETVVVDLDFQEASGSRYRDVLHRWILEEVAKEIPESGMPPDAVPWRDALHWLQDAEKLLASRTLLVVIDEVERVEDGIRAGWCSTDVLDFLRAAGDSLRRIRFLLLTAYPLHRIGPQWVDRLVSATSRTITYLDEPDARELVLAPVPEFPDIYPDGGLERILHETGRHPFLIQKVCEELSSLLNKRGGLRKATAEELTEVFDQVVNQADLFDELWRQRTDEERAVLRQLASAEATSAPSPVARALLREGYLAEQGGRLEIAVPLFRAWILQMQGHA